MIFIGLLIFILGVYLYFRIIRRDMVGIHKFNSEYKIKRNLSIYSLMTVGFIMFVRELIIWLTS
jgi:hypothetical protein